MKRPIDHLVSDLVRQLDVTRREDFEERAAIMQFDGLRSRGDAECLALLDVLRRYPAALAGMVALQVDLAGTTRWLATRDVERSRMHLTGVGGREFAVLDLRAVVADRYSGMAWLSAVL